VGEGERARIYYEKEYMEVWSGLRSCIK
jgi:hypothetical protein